MERAAKELVSLGRSPAALLAERGGVRKVSRVSPDPDGQPLAVSVVSETCPGTVAVGSSGLLAYTPTRLTSGGITCQITYRIADGSGDTDTAVVTVSVTPASPQIFADDFESGNTSAWSASSQ